MELNLERERTINSLVKGFPLQEIILDLDREAQHRHYSNCMKMIHKELRKFKFRSRRLLNFNHPIKELLWIVQHDDRF